VVFDCTFLCAIQPGRRAEWAAKMADVVAPGGELITLIFPVKPGAPDPQDGEVGSGPPFNMSPRLVAGLLEGTGLFSQTSCEAVPADMATRQFAGEYLARWTRK
jgi:hypothetical protein